MATSERSLEELKAHLIHTLDSNGVLGKIRAQLRASVYKVIDADEEPLASAARGGVGKALQSPGDRLLAEMVAEFLQFYDFRHSLSVLIPEASLPKELRNRSEVAYDAGLSRVRTDMSLLEQLVAQASGSPLPKTSDGYHSSASSTTAATPPPPPPPLTPTSGTSPRPDVAATPKTEATPPSVPAGEAEADRESARGDVESNHASESGGSRSGGSHAAAATGGSGSDDSMDEVPMGGRERRKPADVLPSLNSAGAAGAKRLLTPLKTVGGSGGGGGSASAGAGGVSSFMDCSEEGSFDETSMGVSRETLDSEVREDVEELRQIDNKLSRLGRGRAAHDAEGGATSTQVGAPLASHAGSGALERSSPPPHSAASGGSPEHSPACSQGSSPSASGAATGPRRGGDAASGSQSPVSGASDPRPGDEHAEESFVEETMSAASGDDDDGDVMDFSSRGRGADQPSQSPRGSGGVALEPQANSDSDDMEIEESIDGSTQGARSDHNDGDSDVDGGSIQGAKSDHNDGDSNF